MLGRPVLLDNLLIRPDTGVSGIGALEGHSHIASMVVLDPRADHSVLEAVRERAAEESAALAAVTALPVPGLVLRALGHSTGDLERLITAIGGYLRARWFDQPPAALRKY